jgi:hypothetical protein
MDFPTFGGKKKIILNQKTKMKMRIKIKIKNNGKKYMTL